MAKERKKKSQESEEVSTGGVSDWLKKSITNKVGTLLLAEEGMRQDLLGLKLPKNVISAALAQADRTRKDISKLVAEEVRLFLDGIELAELIKKVLSGQSIEISARIKFGSDEPKKAKVRKKTKEKSA